MGWILLGAVIIGGLVGGKVATDDYDEAWELAKAEAKHAWDQAVLAAQLALDTASGRLNQLIGELGSHDVTGEGWATGAGYHLETYEDWYQHVRGEYDDLVAAGLEQSWEDYLFEQQTTRLGEYGLRRAELELEVMFANRALEQATEGLHKAEEFLERKVGLEAAQMMREHETHQAMAGASGMRSGTAHETAAEFQVARMAGLNLWREEALYGIRAGHRDIADAKEKLDMQEQIEMQRLDAFLAGARDDYGHSLREIYGGMEDLRGRLDLSLTAFSPEGRKRTWWGGAFEGARWGAGLFGAFAGATT